MNESKPTGGSETGLDPKVSAMLAYLLGIVGGIVFYAISKDSYVRFHAMQSIFLWVAMVIVYFVLFILSMIIPILWMVNWVVYAGVFAVWVLLLVKAYQGERYKLPVIGDMAEKYSNK